MGEGLIVRRGGTGITFKSVQSGTVTVSTDMTVNVTISNVDTTKSFVMITYTTGMGFPARNRVRAHLSSSTNLRLTRYSIIGSISVHWIVYEIKDLKSLQWGTSDPVEGGTNYTISGVSKDNTLVIYSYDTSRDDSTAGMFTSIRLTTNTNLFIDRYLGHEGYYFKVTWYILEF